MGGLDQFGHYMGRMLGPYDFLGMTLAPAHETFCGELTFTVGGVAFHLFESRPGHSSGDCMVWLPERSVVFAGDVLFVRATPVAWTGPPANIRAALSHLLSLRPEVIVPGHGPLAGPADVRDQIAYWQWLEATLERLARLGADPYEASRRCLESDEFLRSVFARWPDRERIFTSACTLHRHWGMMASTLPGILGTLDHFRRQARIAYAFDTFC